MLLGIEEEGCVMSKIEIDVEGNQPFSDLKARLKLEQEQQIQSLRAAINDLENAARDRLQRFMECVQGQTETAEIFASEGLPELVNQATIAVSQLLDVTLEKPAGFSAKFSTMQVPSGRYRAIFLLFPIPLQVELNRFSADQQGLLMQHIDDLGCTVRTCAVLDELGIRYAYELLTVSKTAVRKCQKGTLKVWKEIQEILASVGLKPMEES
jgi:hypothetical protein